MRDETRTNRKAFSLLEMLVVMGTISMLVAILMPSLSAAREQARGVMCRSNIRQIMLANDYYADDHGGVYVAGAADFLENLNRWHGARSHVGTAFDPLDGPLVPYLGGDAVIRQCPTFPADEIARESDGFERGNGGYGYNNRFIGTQVEVRSSSGSLGEYAVVTDRAGTMTGWVSRPAETIMFTDSAFAADTLIEYSFAEPRFHPEYPLFRAAPSIHFRHRKLANVGWCDGHVDAQKMTFTQASQFYRADPKRFDIGWFGEHDDNRLFDLN